ncbi:MAG: threonine/serine dehydratase [Sneathiella sp.]
MSKNFTLDQFKTAHTRLAPYVRQTPLLEIKLADKTPVFLKLENLQISGSFKIRGALNTVLGLAPDALANGLVTASGGNHGMGVALAGALTETPATIYLPKNTPDSKVAKLKAITPDVIVIGDVWDDANACALEDAKKNGKTYIHPFADASVIEGQGTIALEILEAAPDLDVLIVAIGGGGLISGVATAAKLINPNIRIIGVEAVGAPTLHNSCKAGELVTLDKITTRAGTLAPRRSADLNFSIISKLVEDIILIEDEEMEIMSKWLWDHCGIATELAASAALAAVHFGKFKAEENQKIGVIICGSGYDGF